LGWDQSYQNQYIAARRSVAALSGEHFPQPPAATYVAPPEPVAVPQPAPVADKSWMWKKSTLDSTKQSGVDRSGVHTFEPMVHENAPKGP
jgi:hypothetical protein